MTKMACIIEMMVGIPARKIISEKDLVQIYQHKIYEYLNLQEIMQQ